MAQSFCTTRMIVNQGIGFTNKDHALLSPAGSISLICMHFTFR